MTALSVQPTFPIFTDIDGQPLENGYVWIGSANLDPQTNPVSVYWDAALTIPAAQPIRTLAGYPVNSGTPARLYVNRDYSIRVMNKKGSMVYSAPAATERYSDVVVGGVDASEVTYLPAGTGAVATTVQSKLRESKTSADFGAVADWDGVTGTDAHPALTAAIQSGARVRVLAGRYLLTQPLAFDGVGKEFICDAGVIFNYTGTGNAITLTGRDHELTFGEVTAASGTEVVRYYNLSYSSVYFRVAGMCANAVFLHDGAAQTANAGNNEWKIGRLEAGSVPYGIKLDSSATYTLEGEVWDVKVLFSATNTALVVGSGSGNKVRWNEFNVSIDAQGITPLLIDVDNDFNFFNLRTWSGVEGNTHVRFNSGTGSNILHAQTGVEADLAVVDNGANFYFVPGVAGQMVMGGNLSINLEAGAGASKLAVGDNVPAGSEIAAIENKSTANTTSKYVGLKWRGRDTINTGKDVVFARAIPEDANWQASRLVIYTRQGDVLNVAAEFLPDTSFAVSGNKIIVRNSQTPASATAPGEPGTIAWDINYVYVCVATNAWRRSALTAW